MLQPGTKLGPYRIVAPLGSGGMGVVYRARDDRLGRDVAVKVLPEDVAGDPTRLRRFQQEARAACALHHPHVVSVHDVGSDAGRSYVVSELLEGETLRERIRQGPLSIRRAVEIARQVATGLAAAHEAGIVHRDLKPENVFVLRSGGVKVLDFGLARIVEPWGPGGVDSQARTPAELPPAETRPGTVLGTVGYMSPEQVRGEPADHRTDVFALGVVLHEMLAGARPFRGPSSVETMNAILKDEPPALATLRPEAPAALEAIVRHCLEKRPEDRFQSARDLAFQLESVVLHAGAMAAPTRSRRRSLVALTVVLACLLVAAAAFLVGAGLERPRGGGAAAGATWQQVTFRRGNVLHARFAPDEQTVVYGAAWDGQPVDVYMTRIGNPESRPLGLPRCDVLDVSASGELLLCRREGGARTTWSSGTLARVPLTGGAPRDLAEGVFQASWAPDGHELAISGEKGLEYPVGALIREGAGPWRAPAVSPDGRFVTFIDGGIVIAARGGGDVRVIDVGTHDMTSVAWGPSG